MKKALALLLTFIPSLAWGQGAVLQNGSVTPGDLGVFRQDRSLESARKYTTDTSKGVNSLAILDSGGCGLTLYNTLTNVPHSTVCIGHNLSGAPIVAVDGSQYPLVGTVSGLPIAATKNALSLLSTDTYGSVIRGGFTNIGDVDMSLYVSSPNACTKNGGAGDGGSQIPSSNGKCWVSETTDPLQYGAKRATYGFTTVSTTAGNAQITVTGGTFTGNDVGSYMVMRGVGPYERRYVGQITGFTNATTISLTPAPTQTTTSFSTQFYYGPGAAVPINAAYLTASVLGKGSKAPAGIYMIEAPLKCPVTNYNNANFMPATCGGEPGSIYVAANDMALSTPEPGVMLTYGANDFSQYIRNGIIDGGGLNLDCSFICQKAFNVPFSQEMRITGFQAKNSLFANYQFGSDGSPAFTAAIFIDNLKSDRDIDYAIVTNISSAAVPIVTTQQDSGIPDLRIVTITGANNIPTTGPIRFMTKRIDARHFELHGIDGSGWATFSGTANAALTAPTDSIEYTVFAVSTANPTVIQFPGDLTIANGNIACIYGVGVTGSNAGVSPPTNVPDGCYTISNVGGAGGDGPFAFTVPVNTTGATFTGGGKLTLRNALGDIGMYFTRASDVQVSNSGVVGARWPFYANPVNSGFNMKFTDNHASNFEEQGHIFAAHYVGGFNSLTNEQIDAPAIFGAQFTSGANSAVASYFNGGFTCDGCAWMWRLDSGAVADGSLVVSGGGGNGLNGSVRISELSNALTAGNPPYFGVISNYVKYGWTNGGSMLYYMPNSDFPNVLSGRPSNPAARSSTTQVLMGLGAGGCVFPVRKSGVVEWEIYGTGVNDTAGGGGSYQLYIGTGTPPAAGTAPGVGTAAIGADIPAPLIQPAGGNHSFFKVGGTLATPLIKNTTYWVDLAGRQLNALGNFQPANLACNARE